MYHFENGYNAEVKKVESDSGMLECSIHVTGNDTDITIIHLTLAEVAENLQYIMSQQVS